MARCLFRRDAPVDRSSRVFVFTPEDKRRQESSVFTPVGFNVLSDKSSRTFGDRTEGGVPNSRVALAGSCRWLRTWLQMGAPHLLPMAEGGEAEVEGSFLRYDWMWSSVEDGGAAAVEMGLLAMLTREEWREESRGGGCWCLPLNQPQQGPRRRP